MYVGIPAGLPAHVSLLTNQTRPVYLSYFNDKNNNTKITSRTLILLKNLLKCNEVVSVCYQETTF